MKVQQWRGGKWTARLGACNPPIVPFESWSGTGTLVCLLLYVRWGVVVSGKGAGVWRVWGRMLAMCVLCFVSVTNHIAWRGCRVESCC